MGDPKKLKKRYATPNHPWNNDVLEVERELKREYGLRNKKEILIANSFLKKYKDIAKKLITSQTEQGKKEQVQIMEKLQRFGFLTAGAELDDVLGLELKDILERRLQSVIFRKGLSRSIKQARQFITHRHVKVGEKEINSPGYLITLEEESKLNFKENSALADEEHPERVNIAKEVKAEAEAIKPKEESEGPVEEAVAKPAEVKKEAAETKEVPKQEEVKEEKKVEEAKENVEAKK